MSTSPLLSLRNFSPLLRLIVFRWVALALGGFIALASSANAQITLGAAEDFAVLGGSTVTNTGATVISGDVGVSPGTAITGFPPGTVVNGIIRSNDAVAAQAHNDAALAFTQLGLEQPTSNLTGQNLGGLTLMPGVYRYDMNAQLTGTLNLDTGGNPNALFHFQIGSDLTTASNSSVVLLNGTSDNIFWMIGTSATLGTDSEFVGTIIADQSITLTTGAALDGRALAINGAVTLDSNTIRLVVLSDSGDPAVIEISGSSGDTVLISTGTLLGLEVAFHDSAVLLEFTQGSFADLDPIVGLTPNELAVATALDDLAADQSDNELIGELNSLQIADVPGALSLLSPEDFGAIFTTGLAISQVQIGNLERRLSEVRQGRTGFSDSDFAVTDSRGAQNYDGKRVLMPDGKASLQMDAKGDVQFEEESDTESYSANRDHRWGFFISGTGELGDLESTSLARGSSFATGGVTVGTDYRVNRHLVVGAALGYASTSSDLSRGGDLDIDSGKGSLYATLYGGGFYLNGIVGAGYGSIDTKRRTIGGFAHGRTDAIDFNGLLGTGYDFRHGALTWGPVASLQYTTVGIDSFEEQHALGALRIHGQSQDSLKSAVGMRAAYSQKAGRVVITPEIRAQWQHEHLDSRSSIDAGFAPGNSFTVHGPEIGRDALLLDVGASVQLSSKVAIFGYYTGELGRENYTVHSINAGVRVSF